MIKLIIIIALALDAIAIASIVYYAATDNISRKNTFLRFIYGYADLITVSAVIVSALVFIIQLLTGLQ